MRFASDMFATWDFIWLWLIILIGEQPNSSPMFSPEHRVFGYSADSPLSEDEENEVVFSP